MPELHILRVFANEDGSWGNLLGVFLEGSAIPERARPALAASLGFSETVFVEDRERGRMRIHTPQIELPFAGHPTVGAAWLLAETGAPANPLRPPAGEVEVQVEGGATFVSADPGWAPPFEYEQLGSAAAVMALEGPPRAGRNTYAWAWIDEATATIRARSFVPEAGIAEDEATGSAALALAAKLGRPIVVHQGRGSLILARPTGDGRAAVGGKVVLEGVREEPLRGP